MLRLSALIACLINCCTIARTQTVLPASVGARVGSAADAVGIADTSARVQYLCARSSTGFSKSVLITQLSMRLDEGVLTPARNDLSVSIRLSTRAVNPSRVPFANFDLNDGLTLGAWRSTTLSLPAVTTTGVTQSFFKLPLSAPFATDADGTLCVDIKYSTQASGPFAQRLDAVQGSVERFRRTNFGTGCPRSAQSNARGFYVGNQSSLGAYTEVDGLPPSTIALAVLGAARADVALALSYGGQACRAYTIASLIHPIAISVPSNSNYARFTWLNAQQLAQVQLKDLKAVVQHLFLDRSFRLGASDGLEIVVGDGNAARSFVTVYGSSSLKAGFDPDRDQALAFAHRAVVLEVR